VTLTTLRDGDVSVWALHGTADQTGAPSLLAAGRHRATVSRCCETSQPGSDSRVKSRAGKGSPIPRRGVAAPRSISAVSCCLRAKRLTVSALSA
jgi:hypothetical protein